MGVYERGDAAFLQEGVHLINCYPFRQVGDHPQPVAALTQSFQCIQCIAVEIVLTVNLFKQGMGEVEEDCRAHGIASYGINQRAILCRAIYECFQGRMKTGYNYTFAYIPRRSFIALTSACICLNCIT